MSVLLEDARARLQHHHGVWLPQESLNELLYADDTLFIGAHGRKIEKYLSCSVDIGSEYGLEMNWSKVELMRVQSNDLVTGPGGRVLQPKDSFIYLGSSVAADGDVNSELSRRLGMARADFDKIRQVWSHTRLSNKEKLQISTSCVVSRLLYGLQVMWLGKAAQVKLDGFYARCLRKIAGVQAAYWSRVSNAAVLGQLGATQLHVARTAVGIFWQACVSAGCMCSKGNGLQCRLHT